MLEIFVPRLQPSPVLLEEHLRVVLRRRRAVAAGPENQSIVDLEVRREEDAVLVLDEEAPYLLGIVRRPISGMRAAMSAIMLG